MPHFVRGLAEVGVEIIGVGNADPSELGVTSQYLTNYVKLDASVMNEIAAHDELVGVLRDLKVDSVEALWEPLVLLAARVRDTLELGGMTRDTVLGFRDKQLMKDRLAAAGLRVPRSVRAATVDEMRQGGVDVGFPCVIKPIAGAGSADTYFVGDAAQLEGLVDALAHVHEVSVEEYVVGEEFTYDCVSIDGEPVFDSVAQYFPKPLESRSQEWISPAQIVYADPGKLDKLAPGVELGRGVLKALGMQTGFTHMEWFLTPSGEAVFGEIGARPPGAKLVDQMNWANDFDVYRGWAEAVATGAFTQHAARAYHVACIFKRATGEGRITHVAGADAIRRDLGPHIVEDALLPIGAQRRNWRATLLSDGWLVVRHPDLDECRRMMDRIITDVRMFAG